MSQVLIGYVNTTSTQVFVYADGHNNGTVFPGECAAITQCYPTTCVTHVMCHFGNSTCKSENIERYMYWFDWSVAPKVIGSGRYLRLGGGGAPMMVRA